jgi:GNAT superfamily N-acetyltransferase
VSASLDDTFVIAAIDPRGPEAAELIRGLSEELAQRYDFIDDGAARFHPEDALGPRAAFLVGRVGGVAVACGALRPLEGDVAEVKRMFVAPEVRGRGFGGLILAALERQAAALGYAAVWLETGDLQPEAIRLYERAGYRRIDAYGPYVGIPHSVCFEKVLSAGR